MSSGSVWWPGMYTLLLYLQWKSWKKIQDDILFDRDGLPKGHAVGLLPIVMIAELIVGSKVQNSTTTTCNFFIPWLFTFPEQSVHWARLEDAFFTNQEHRQPLSLKTTRNDSQILVVTKQRIKVWRKKTTCRGASAVPPGRRVEHVAMPWHNKVVKFSLNPFLGEVISTNYQTLNLERLERKPQEQTSQRKLRLEVFFYLWTCMLDLLFDDQSEPESFISVSVRILYSILNIDLSNYPHHDGLVVKQIWKFLPLLQSWIPKYHRNEGSSAT